MRNYFNEKIISAKLQVISTTFQCATISFNLQNETVYCKFSSITALVDSLLFDRIL